MSFISEDVKAKYPGFANLFEVIVDKKEKQLAAKKESTAEAVDSKHLEARSLWLKYETIYQSTLQVIKLKLVEALKGNLSPEKEKFWKSFRKVFEATECLSCKFVNGQGPFGITKQEIQDMVFVEKGNWGAGRSYLDDALTEYLESTCMELANFYDGVDYTCREKIQRTRAVHLHEVIKSDNNKLLKLTQELQSVNEKKVNLFIKTIQLLHRCAELLEKFVETFNLKLLPKRDSVEVKSLHMTAQTIALKIKATKLSLMVETYSKDNMEALKQIRRTLDDRMVQTTTKLNNIERDLAAYHSLGSDYKKIVDEYTRKTEEIEKRKWMITEMKRKTATKMNDDC